MRRRQVIGALNGISVKCFRNLVADGRVRKVVTIGYPLYLKASLAPLLGLAMDWSGFEHWPALLTRWHLLEAGLHDEDMAALVAAKRLLVLKGHGAPRYHKWQVAEMVGYLTTETPRARR